jgi:hypothetical protein
MVMHVNYHDAALATPVMRTGVPLAMFAMFGVAMFTFSVWAILSMMAMPFAMPLFAVTGLAGGFFAMLAIAFLALIVFAFSVRAVGFFLSVLALALGLFRLFVPLRFNRGALFRRGAIGDKSKLKCRSGTVRFGKFTANIFIAGRFGGWGVAARRTTLAFGATFSIGPTASALPRTATFASLGALAVSAHEFFLADGTIAIFIIPVDHVLNAFAILVVFIVGVYFAVLILVDAIKHRLGIAAARLSFGTIGTSLRTGPAFGTTRTARPKLTAGPTALKAFAHLLVMFYKFFFRNRTVAIPINPLK